MCVASRNNCARVRTARAVSHLEEKCQKVWPRRVSKPRARAVSTNRAIALSSAEVK